MEETTPCRPEWGSSHCFESRITHTSYQRPWPRRGASFSPCIVSHMRVSLPSALAAASVGSLTHRSEREALWINFGAWNNYAIKIYAGGVNVVSGEAADETDEIRKRRLERVKKKESIQDFVIAPDQCWIDGIATEPGKVRQFVAMPMGAGYSIESQVKGEEVTGGLQFEITRIKRKRPPPTMTIFVKLYNGLQRTEPFLVDPGTYYGQDLIDMIGEQIFPVGARDILMLGGRAIKSKCLEISAFGSWRMDCS